MWKHPCLACVGLILFWHEGCFWFGCLPSLSSACTGRYSVDRGCAGEQPMHFLGRWGPVVGAWSQDALLGRWGQQLTPGPRTLSGGRLHAFLGRRWQWLAPGHRACSQGGEGSSWHPAMAPLVVVGHAHSWGGGGSGRHLVSEPLLVAVVHTHLWSSTWQQRLVPIPRSLCRLCPAA